MSFYNKNKDILKSAFRDEEEFLIFLKESPIAKEDLTKILIEAKNINNKELKIKSSGLNIFFTMQKHKVLCEWFFDYNQNKKFSGGHDCFIFIENTIYYFESESQTKVVFKNVDFCDEFYIKFDKLPLFLKSVLLNERNLKFIMFK